MATACILVLAALAAAAPSPGQTSRASQPRPRVAEPGHRAAPAGDLPRLASGYRATRVNLRWRAPDAYGATTVVVMARRRDALQPRGDRALRARLAMAELADPGCRIDAPLTAPCPR